MKDIKNINEFIKKDFFNNKTRNNNINSIRVLFDLFQKDKYTIDDTTWNDLDMDAIFHKIDRTYSSPGEAALYTLLRNPAMNEKKIKKRHKTIEFFRKNIDLSCKIRKSLFYLGFDNDNRLIEMLEGLLTVSKKKFIIYTILGQVLPILLILLCIILRQPYFILVATFIMYINIGIHQKEIFTVKATGLIKLSKLLKSAKEISKVKCNELSIYTEKISNLINELSFIDKAMFLIRIVNSFGGLFEFISVPFLLEVSVYYKISGKLIEQESKILELYYLIGEIDALISMASYKESVNDKISTPTFVNETSLNISNGIHPLIDDSVPNSINIDNKGIVLTGTNMSGKSTFLRMLTINILFAQCFNFVLAKKYIGCFFNIVTSISPKDDIDSGKSYYMAEAESILRVLQALEYDAPVFTSIDEIFRGTNPIERISSSCEILNYINKKNALCIVSTHDRELTDLLKDNYDFYYFSEDVNSSTGLSFDYKLKHGISNTRNAIKLLEYMGFPKEITDNAYKRCCGN